MNRKFSFYEFVGVIVPGFIAIVVAAWIFNVPFETVNSYSAVSAALILIGAYAAGHIIQSIGNCVESIWWCIRGGMPTYWILSPSKASKIMSDNQLNRLQNVVLNMAPDYGDSVLQQLTRGELRGIISEMYAIISVQGDTSRIDIFNGNYGLFRGMCGAFAMGIILLIVKLIYERSFDCLSTVIISILTVMCLHRMDRFAKHYAKELYSQILTIKSKKS